jgi:transposase-like protein
MQTYSSEFKIEAVKRTQTSGLPIARVAEELGVNENTFVFARVNSVYFN